jgi:threonine/homoserine/homoserine lactone efflux protein
MKAANATASALLALFLCLTAALGIAAAVEAPPSLMSRADYLGALRMIHDGGRLALARCREPGAPAERAVCRAEARAAERVAIAALGVRYHGTLAARAHARRVQARAEHSVAMVRRLATT